MKKIKYLGVAGVFVGIVLSKILGNYFGSDSRITLMFVVLIFTFIMIIFIALKKNYGAAILLFLVLAPLIITLLGMYLNNLYMLFGGLILFFVVLIILLKYLNKKNKSV